MANWVTLSANFHHWYLVALYTPLSFLPMVCTKNGQQSISNPYSLDMHAQYRGPTCYSKMPWSQPGLTKLENIVLNLKIMSLIVVYCFCMAFAGTFSSH